MPKNDKIRHISNFINIYNQSQGYVKVEAMASVKIKLKKTQAIRTRFINQISSPIKKSLSEKGLNFEIKGRPKSIYSIWNKMEKKNYFGWSCCFT
jgi:(p)ppGpp synthase/HD superfamily hydrolase